MRRSSFRYEATIGTTFHTLTRNITVQKAFEGVDNALQGCQLALGFDLFVKDVCGDARLDDVGTHCV